MTTKLEHSTIELLLLCMIEEPLFFQIIKYVNSFVNVRHKNLVGKHQQSFVAAYYRVTRCPIVLELL